MAVETTIHIHLGPHKTGTTSIQSFIYRHSEAIYRETGVLIAAKGISAQLGLALSRDNEINYKDNLTKIKSDINLRRPAHVLLSSEDFCGRLPGRRRAETNLYPSFRQNIQRLEDSFSEFQRLYYFFVRDPWAWIRSCYFQYKKHAATAMSEQEYISRYFRVSLEAAAITPAEEILNGRFFQIPYFEGDSFCSVRSIFSGITPLATFPLDNYDIRRLHVSDG